MCASSTGVGMATGSPPVIATWARVVRLPICCAKYRRSPSVTTSCANPRCVNCETRPTRRFGPRARIATPRIAAASAAAVVHRIRCHLTGFAGASPIGAAGVTGPGAASAGGRPSGATNRYPRRGMVSMAGVPSRPSASALRNAKILTERFPSSTCVSGQTRRMISSRSTSFPGVSARTQRIRTALGDSGAGFPSRRSSLCSRSSWNGPNSSTVHQPASRLKRFLIISQQNPKDFQRCSCVPSTLSEGARSPSARRLHRRKLDREADTNQV